MAIVLKLAEPIKITTEWQVASVFSSRPFYLPAAASTSSAKFQLDQQVKITTEFI
jgi:hypothetical protein